jgi:glutaconate CoA-transferase subunit B
LYKNSKKKTKYSTSEFLACILSRQLVDTTLGLVGANALVPMAACMLAQELQAPNLTWISGGSGYVNPMYPLVISSSSYRERAEAVLPMERVLALQGQNIDFFFAGGIQIDKIGRLNLVGVGNPFKAEYKLRGPGSAGVAFLSKAKQVFYYTNRHDKNVFVKKLDFVSAVPSPPRDLDKQKRTKKPHIIVTPLGVFSFSPPDIPVTPVSIHPGITREELIINTGFHFKENLLHVEIPMTMEPTEEELELLRDKIDPKGLLRKN